MALANPRGVSPQKMAADLRVAATDGSRDIQQFKKDFHSPEMRELWLNTSTADYSQGRDSWVVNYQELVKGLNAGPIAPNPKPNGDARSPNESAEDIERLVNQCKTANPSIQISFANQPNTLPIDIKLDDLSFQLTAYEEDNRRSFSVGPLSGAKASELENQIAAYINEHSASSGLETVLVRTDSTRAKTSLTLIRIS